jgi:single stranded DNA-binding protein
MARDRDDFNSSTISGRLTRNPDIRTIPDGGTVMDFYVACNRYLPPKAEGEKMEQLTSFVKVTVWNKRAEKLSKLLHCGDEVLVQGQLVDDNFMHDGERTSGRIKIDNVVVVKILNRVDIATE